MLIPIRDENPTTRRAWVTGLLIAANLAVFLLWQPTFEKGQLGQVRQEVFFFCHAEIPWEVTHGTNLASGGAAARAAITRDLPGIDAGILQRVLQGDARDVQGCPTKNWALSVFEAMFLHGGWLHILGNMLFLWVFGNNVEDRMGPAVYLGFYLLGGVAASVAQIATDPSSAVPNLGASGAIAAVLGAYLVMFPRNRVLSVVVFFIWTLVELPAVVVLGFWFLLQLFSGVGGIASNVTGGVAYFAHIGGFAFGAVVALLFYRRRRPPRQVTPERWRPY